MPCICGCRFGQAVSKENYYVVMGVVKDREEWRRCQACGEVWPKEVFASTEGQGQTSALSERQDNLGSAPLGSGGDQPQDVVSPQGESGAI